MLPAIERSGNLLVAHLEESESGSAAEFDLADARIAELIADELSVSAALLLVARSGAQSLEEALELMEAWSPAEAALHPRWPPKTPGGLGGKFMARGQRFALNGVQYDVDFGVPGGVYAHVATLGNIANARHVFLPLKDLAKVVRPPAAAMDYKNAAHNATAGLTATVIDPYVQHDHDASIPIPPDAPVLLTPERWLRFGRADQLRYVDLMHQFGPWKDSVAQTKLNAELSKQPSDLVTFLKGAYDSQFNSSSGFTIGLLQVFSKWFQGGKSPSQTELEKDREKYERLKQVQDAAARVIQWDLYNRVGAPDVTVFHKSHDSPATWKQKWLGKEPIFSGLSQTQRYSFGGFGPTGVATPLAIRNIVMASTSANVEYSGLAEGEQEVAVGEPMRYDDRSYVFQDNALDSGERAALTTLTQSGSDGSTVDLIRNRLEHGDPFPSVPVEPNIQMLGQETQWLAPPQAATVGIGKLDYAEKDADGVPVARPAADLELKPGDYIEGMKGTRYIVIADPSSSYGIRYWKVTDQGTPVGAKKPYTLGPIHDAETGNQAFAGHSESGGGESYAFTIELPFKKLAGHYALPTQKVGVTNFVAKAWAQSGEKTKVKDLALGSKFYVGAVPYEVTGGMSGGTVPIKSLLSGLPGTVSSGYLTTHLKLKEGYTEEGVPAFDPGGYFVGKPATLAELGLKAGDVFLAGQSGTSMAWQVAHTHGAAPLEVVGIGSGNQGKTNILALSVQGRKLTVKPDDWFPPTVGDTLAVGGKKGEVTKLLKNGYVQVNTHPGVVKIAPDDPLLAGLFSPDKYAVGPKMKVRDMQPGVKFHAGSGGKVKPYVVVSTGAKVNGKAGSFAVVQNLDTGEQTLVGYQKSFSVLLSSHATAPEPSGQTAEGLAEVYNPAAWKEAGKVPTMDLKVGDKFSSTLYGQTEIVADKGAAWEAKALQTSATFPVMKSDIEVTLLEPNGAMPAIAFDAEAYVEGAATKFSDLKPGDIFKGTAKGKHYVVTKTGAKSGLSAIDLETGAKSGPWKYDKVAPILVSKLGKNVKPGGAALLSELGPGDQFSINGQVHQVVSAVDAKEKNATVAAVLPGGSLGFPGKVGWYPGLAVTFHQSAENAKAEQEKLSAVAPQLASTDAVELLPPAGIASYSQKSKSGGGYTFLSLMHAPEGTILEDKEGSHFLVKVAGAQPVVSDGQHNWKLDGMSKLKVAKPGTTFVDNAPAVTASKSAATSNAWAEMPGLSVNYPNGKSFKELGLVGGDYFVANGKAYKITPTGSTFSSNIYAVNLETKNAEVFGVNHVPTSWAKAGPSLEQTAVPAPSSAVDLNDLSTFTKNMSAATVKSLPVGSLFTTPSAHGTDFQVWKVLDGLDGGLIPVEVVNPGGIGVKTTVGADFVFGYSVLPGAPTKLYLHDAEVITKAPLVHVPVPSGGWKDNSLVKLTTEHLAPGTFYKSANGNEWLWYGANPELSGSGLAELVSKDVAGNGTPGDVYNIGVSFVPSDIGPQHSFLASDFEQDEKVLMSALKPGDVYTAKPGLGEVAKVLLVTPGVPPTNTPTALVVASQASGVQSQPYALSVLQGFPVWRMKAKKSAQAGSVWTPAPAWTNNTAKLAVKDLPVGAEFQWGVSGDVFTIKSSGPTPLVVKNEGDADELPLTAFGTSGWVPEKVWLPTTADELAPSADYNDYHATGFKGHIADLEPGSFFVYQQDDEVPPTVFKVLSQDPPSIFSSSASVVDVQTGMKYDISSNDEFDYVNEVSHAPAKYGETDEYLVQALVDAHAKNDEDGYFEAEAEIAQHMVTKGLLTDEEYASFDDDGTSAKVNAYVDAVVADKGIKAPGGGVPFEGEGMPKPESMLALSVDDFAPTGEKMTSAEAPVGAYLSSWDGNNVLQITGDAPKKYLVVAGPDKGETDEVGVGGVKLVVLERKGTTATQFDTLLSTLGPGDEFETQDGGKWVVKSVGIGGTVFTEPIGMEGEDQGATWPKAAASTEKVNVLSKGKGGTHGITTKQLSVGDFFQTTMSSLGPDIAEPGVWKVAEKLADGAVKAVLAKGPVHKDGHEVDVSDSQPQVFKSKDAGWKIVGDPSKSAGAEIAYLHMAPLGALVQKPSEEEHSSDTTPLWKITKTNQKSGMVDVVLVAQGTGAYEAGNLQPVGTKYTLDGGNGPWVVVPPHPASLAALSAEVGDKVKIFASDPPYTVTAKTTVDGVTKWKLMPPGGDKAILVDGEWESADGFLEKAKSGTFKAGDPVMYGEKKAWVKYVSTDAKGKVTLGLGSTPGGAGAANVAVAFSSSVTLGHSPDAETPSPPTDWKPYSEKSKTGGGYTFANLNQLDPGATFTDKSGNFYTLKNVAGSSATSHPTLVSFTDEAGTVYEAPGHSRVKLV